MSTKEHTSETPTPKQKKTPKQTQKPNKLGQALLWATTLSSLTIATFAIKELNQHKETTSALNSQLKRIQSQVNLQSQRHNSALEQIEQKTKHTLTKVEQLSGTTKLNAILQDVSEIIQLASHRLQLTNNIDHVNHLLTEANILLAQAPEQLAPLQKNIDTLREQANSKQHINTTDIINTLDHISTQVAQLPLKKIAHTLGTTINTSAEQEINEEPTNKWDTLRNKSKQFLNHAIKIRRTKDFQAPIHSTEQATSLKLNLQLVFEQARLAVIERNTENYQSSIKKLIFWINEYYETNSENGANILAALLKLKDQSIEQPTLDITPTIKMIHTLQANLTQGSNENI